MAGNFLPALSTRKSGGFGAALVEIKEYFFETSFADSHSIQFSKVYLHPSSEMQRFRDGNILSFLVSTK